MNPHASLPQITVKAVLLGIVLAAVLEYFSPLQAWLKQQNEGKTCGWNAQGTAAAAAPAKPANG